MRDKIKILFSNHKIKITKKELNKSSEKREIVINREKDMTIVPEKRNEEEIEIKKQSPLGFYYTQKKYKQNRTSSVSNRLRLFEIYNNSVIYEIQYYTIYHNKSIDIENRPWDIIHDEKSMENHFVTDLLNVVKSIITEYEGLKFPVYIQHSDPYYRYYTGKRESTSFYNFKKTLMTELFGFIDGPKYQTDEEKILSHGFDIKESFRNRKEK